MKYKITFKGNSKKDSYTAYSSSMHGAIRILTSRTSQGYNGKIAKV